MSATEIINELPKLTETERRAIFGKLLELEDLPLSQPDEALIESRLAAHRANPETSVPLEEVKSRFRSESFAIKAATNHDRTGDSLAAL